VSERHGWRVESACGLTLLRCEALTGVPGVAHAFSTRCADGHDGFDLGRADAHDPQWTARRHRFGAAVGLVDSEPAVLSQVHGSRVVRTGSTPTEPHPRADGMLALRGDRSRVAPAVRVADCVPVLLASRDGSALAALHAGWRGTAQRIVGGAVKQLAGLGLRPAELIAAVGPSIGACCYEVDEKTAGAVAAASGAPTAALAPGGPSGRPMLDLGRANLLQLLEAGLGRSSVHIAPWCTACTPEWFYSYRRDGTATGRLMACIGWA
jgi:YfiH family protein